MRPPELLDAGGPEASYLARSGRSRRRLSKRPYRHFADKEGLLSAVASESWDRLANALRKSGTTSSEPSTRLQEALMAS